MDLLIAAGRRALAVRLRVEWDRGRAALFVPEHARTVTGAVVLYVGDERTDDAAFRAQRAAGVGEGIVVADPPPAETSARSYLRNPVEVGRRPQALAHVGPSAAPPQPEG